MATDLERLVVRLEAQMKTFENEMKRSRSVADRETKAIEDRFNKLGPNITRAMASAGKGVTAALGAISAGVAIREVQQLADTYTQAGNKIAASAQSAGKPIEDMGSTLNIVGDIAQRSRSSFEATADLYARLTRSSTELGVSQTEIAVATEVVAKSLKSSGASAAETSSALTQLGQALGSGKLQGDELRSLLESAPGLAQVIAREFNTTIGGLRELGSTGELTSRRVFDALLKAAPEVEAAFAKTKATVADAFTEMTTAATRYVGQSTAVGLGTQAVIAATQGLANNFGTLANGAAALGLVISARLIGAGFARLVPALTAASVASAGAVGSVNLLNAAMAVSVARMNASALAARAFTGSLALVGGPVGAAIVGVTLALGYAASKSAEAKVRSDEYAAALDRQRAAADAAAGANNKNASALSSVAARAFEAQKNELSRTLATSQNDLKGFADTIDKELGRAASAMRSKGLSSSAGAEVDALRAKFKTGEITSEQLAEALFKLANSNPRFQNIAEKLSPVLTAFAGLSALISEVKGKLETIGPAAKDPLKDAEKNILAAGAAGRDPDAGNPLDKDPAFQRIVNDAVVRSALQKAGMSDAAKAVAAEADRIQKEALDRGGNISREAAVAAAKRVQSLTEAQKESGKSSGLSEEDQRYNRVVDYIDQLQKAGRALDAEIASIGKSNAERQKAIELARIGTVTDQAQLKIIDDEVAASERKRQVLEQIKTARQGEIDAANFAGNALIDGIDQIVLQGGKAEDVIKSLTASLARAALQAMLLGQGPLAGLFGTAPGSGAGGIGGLIGSLFSPGRASGGPVQAGRVYPVGENGPELAVFGQNGHVIPNAALSGRGSGGTSITNQQTFQFNGGFTFDQVRDEARRAARIGAEQGRRMAINDLSQSDRRGTMR